MLISSIIAQIPILSTLVRYTSKSSPQNIESPTSPATSGACNYDDLDAVSTASTPTYPDVATPGTRSPRDRSLTLDQVLGSTHQQSMHSNVDWEMAEVGVRLWLIARNQAHNSSDLPLLRSMHIDAVKYMHMALPADLTSTEIKSLQTSLSQTSITSRDVLVVQRPPRSNQLRRCVAQLVCWWIAMMLFIVPLFMNLLNILLQFERDHHITERLVTNSLECTYAVGIRGIDLHTTLMRFRQGRVGIAVVEVGNWMMEGIVSGVHDGITMSLPLEPRPMRQIE